MAWRILGEYEDEYLKMLAFIERFPDLQETPAQFQERCAQVALACFWEERQGKDKQPHLVERPDHNHAPRARHRRETVAECPFVEQGAR